MILSFIDSTGCDHDKCALRHTSGNRSVGIPTRLFSPNRERMPRCVLIVGEAPGSQEDRSGTSWIGRTGELLSSFLVQTHLADHADIYLANACRCRPPLGKKPTVSQVRYCRRRWLLADIDILCTAYPHVVLFANGASASYAIFNRKLSAAFHCQGHRFCSLHPELPDLTTTVNPYCFCTYHPAALFTGRNPQWVEATELHWDLLARHLAGDPERALPDNIHYTLNPNPERILP